MMSRGIFITGTDTGVGKTYVAAGIAAELRRRRVAVGVMKPAETGCPRRNNRMVPRDAIRLMKAAGVRDPLSLVNPYRFQKPLAPSVAADLAGKKIDPDKIITAYKKLSRRHEFMIIEGAGGIMVPLSENYLFLELARELGLPVMVVARPVLGAINHTLLTISALRERGTVIAGVVINYAEGRKGGLAAKTSPGVIESISGTGILGIVPHGSKEFNMIADGLN
jgi:dethiobiotin synthetase